MLEFGESFLPQITNLKGVKKIEYDGSDNTAIVRDARDSEIFMGAGKDELVILGIRELLSKAIIERNNTDKSLLIKDSAGKILLKIKDAEFINNKEFSSKDLLDYLAKLGAEKFLVDGKDITNQIINSDNSEEKPDWELPDFLKNLFKLISDQINSERAQEGQQGNWGNYNNYFDPFCDYNNNNNQQANNLEYPSQQFPPYPPYPPQQYSQQGQPVNNYYNLPYYQQPNINNLPVYNSYPYLYGQSMPLQQIAQPVMQQQAIPVQQVIQPVQPMQMAQLAQPAIQQQAIPVQQAVQTMPLLAQTAEIAMPVLPRDTSGIKINNSPTNTNTNSQNIDI